MTSYAFLTTSEVAKLLGITRQAVLQRVESGRLVPVHKNPTVRGAYIFEAADVENQKSLA